MHLQSAYSVTLNDLPRLINLITSLGGRYYYYSSHKGADPESEITLKEGRCPGRARSQPGCAPTSSSQRLEGGKDPLGQLLISACFLLIVNNSQTQSHGDELEPSFG